MCAFSLFESPCLCFYLLSSPLCLYSALCWGPPHQSRCFLPSPSQLTTQQVEHWSLRTLLLPGSLCPGVCMMYSAQAPRLSWVAVSGRLPPRTGLLRPQRRSAWPGLPSLLPLLLLLRIAAAESAFIPWVLMGLPPSLPSPFPNRQGGCICPPIQALVVSWSHLADMLPGHHVGRISALFGLRMQKES